jgi:methyl-accepting chemotaxis protein
VIGEVSESLGQVSNGNLAISIEKEYPGNFSNISSAIKHIIESLNEKLWAISTEQQKQVASGSEQVSDSSQATGARS